MDITLDETTIQHLEEIKTATGSTKDLLGLIQECVYTQRVMFVTNTERVASWQPIYTDTWVYAEKNEQGAIPVNGYSEDGEYSSYLRRATQEEVGRAALGSDARWDKNENDVFIPTILYVEIRHRIEYPFSAVDWTEIVDYTDPIENLFGRRQPRKFCTAAVVATPQMKLF